MKADVLSDVLGTVHLTGSLLRLRAPALPGCRGAPIVRDRPEVMPGAQRVVGSRVIARGSCSGHSVGDGDSTATKAI